MLYPLSYEGGEVCAGQRVVVALLVFSRFGSCPVGW
jgi:hypothetical protein